MRENIQEAVTLDAQANMAALLEQLGPDFFQHLSPRRGKHSKARADRAIAKARRKKKRR